MQSLAARIASFKPPSRRTKNSPPTWSISPTTHPNLTPQKLAEAGFFFNPSTEEPDNCQCFSCGLQLGGWDEEDDPFVEQCKRSDCAWGEMVCAPRVARDRDEINMTVADEALLPSSAASTQTRILTFQGSSGESFWPHKPKKTWKPSIENVAAAGFVFLETPDDVMCPYCQYTIGAWEASDDPMEVHQTKKPNCPFFTIALEPQASKPTAKAAPKPRATRAKRTTTATVAASLAGSVMGQEDELTEISEPAKKGRKAKATTAKGKGKKVAESEIAESVMEEDEEESQAVVQKEVEKPKRRGGTRSKKAEVEPTEPDFQMMEEVKEVIEPKKKERKPRATKASKKAETEAAEAEALSRAEAKVDIAPVVEDEPMEVVEDKESTPKTTKSTSSRATKSSKSNPSSSAASVPIPEPMSAPSVPSKPARPIKSIRAAKLDKSTKSAPSASQPILPESVPVPSSSSSRQPTASKPPSSKSKSTSATSKPLPPTPQTSYPSASQPLNQLTHFANVPPTSPMVPEDPARQQLDTDLGEMAKSARGVVMPEKDGEEWMKEPLTAAEKKMTIEQLINRQMGRRALVIEEEGEEMIRKWKEGAVAIRGQIQAALR